VRWACIDRFAEGVPFPCGGPHRPRSAWRLASRVVEAAHEGFRMAIRALCTAFVDPRKLGSAARFALGKLLRGPFSRGLGGIVWIHAHGVWPRGGVTVWPRGLVPRRSSMAQQPTPPTGGSAAAHG